MESVTKDVVKNGKAVTVSGYNSMRPLFDPKSKQVFAALNYGRRPHGSSTAYGDSYLVLKESFKADSIYFARDTFLGQGVQDQVSYQSLAALYLKGDPDLRHDIVSSCLDNIRLGDTTQMGLLVEAHIFAPVLFRSSVSTLVLETTNNPVIVQNATKFCRKFGISMVRQ